MSKNRSKIWITNDRYIYRSDYNVLCEINKRKHIEETFEETCQNCRQYSHLYRGKKYSTVWIKFNDYTFCRGIQACEILRCDYNFSDVVPEQMIVRILSGEYKNCITEANLKNKLDYIIEMKD